MSIKKKLSALLILWSFIVLFAGNTIVFLAFLYFSKDRLETSLENSAEQLAESVGSGDALFSDPEPILHTHVPHVPDEGMIRLFNAQHQKAYVKADEEDLLAIKPVFPKDDQTRIVKGEDFTAIVASRPIMENGKYVGMLELSMIPEDLFEDIRLLLTILLGSTAILIVLAAFVGVKTSGLFLKPVSTMMKTMADIEENGRFEKIPLAPDHHDELYQMALTFNAMIERLEAMFKKQEQFIYDASHELKTPLTVIESYAAMLRRWGKDDPEILAEGIAAISDESRRLNSIAEQLLALARSEDVSYALQPVDAASLCRQTARRLSQSASRSISVKAEKPGLYAWANEEKFVQVLVILLDNALKYSRSPVQIEVGSDHDFVTVTVIDQGTGIPKEDLPHLFERFYRVDKARTRGTGGTGLGLSIAHSIMNQHGGEIRMESEEGKGTRVCLRFKKAVDAPWSIRPAPVSYGGGRNSCPVPPCIHFQTKQTGI